MTRGLFSKTCVPINIKNESFIIVRKIAINIVLDETTGGTLLIVKGHAKRLKNPLPENKLQVVYAAKSPYSPYSLDVNSGIANIRTAIDINFIGRKIKSSFEVNSEPDTKAKIFL